VSGGVAVLGAQPGENGDVERLSNNNQISWLGGV